MNKLAIKKVIAVVADNLQLPKLKLNALNKELNNNYIRAINYHSTEEKYSKSFERQVAWFAKNFVNVNKETLDNFWEENNCILDGDKPGVMFTFDDGFTNNYTMAAPILDMYGMTGYFFVSSDLVGTEGYMTWEQLRDLKARGHVIGCHTATHHRMEKDDTPEILKHEIVDSKKTIEEQLGECDIFCWCGGEEEHYTKIAADEIAKAGYKYSFMTCSYPITQAADRLQLQRSNLEAEWSASLMRFQVCGIMDGRFAEKRKRVEALTRQ